MACTFIKQLHEHCCQGEVGFMATMRCEKHASCQGHPSCLRINEVASENQPRHDATALPACRQHAAGSPFSMRYLGSLLENWGCSCMSIS